MLYQSGGESMFNKEAKLIKSNAFSLTSSLKINNNLGSSLSQNETNSITLNNVQDRPRCANCHKLTNQVDTMNFSLCSEHCQKATYDLLISMNLMNPVNFDLIV
jgi:hypothetical protein